MRYSLVAAALASCQDVLSGKSKGPAPEDPFRDLRAQMVKEQIADRNVSDPEVLRAMRTVPRHLFVDRENRKAAYGDHPVAIGQGQTISQPYVVALMTEALKIRKGLKVLEIGTGSGYQAAVLAEMGAQTFSVEIIPELAARAKENLARAGYASVRIKTGDGYQGWAEHAPYDAVLVTCAPEDIPLPLVEQLKEGGRMVIPVGAEGAVQELYRLQKVNGRMGREALAPVRFVPMTGEAQKKVIPR